MGYLNVLVAALAAFAFSALWYTVLSKHWLRATGLPLDEQGKPLVQSSVMPFVIGTIAYLLVAGMMRHIFASSGVVTPVAGLVSGFGVGAFIITPWVSMNYAFAQRQPMLSVLDAGNAIVGCAIIGLVLNLF